MQINGDAATRFPSLEKTATATHYCYPSLATANKFPTNIFWNYNYNSSLNYAFDIVAVLSTNMAYIMFIII